MTDDTEREALIDTLVMTKLSDYAGQEMALINAAADRILAKFLPAHDERVKAEAWDEAQRALIDIRISGAGYASVVREPLPENPYRRES